MEVIAECEACGGTGLYCGFAEPKGTAVVCRICNGTGCHVIHYKPFTGRRRREGVERVMGDGGLWFVRTGNEQIISVDEFYNRSN